MQRASAVRVSLVPAGGPVEGLRVEFVTPTELKAGAEIAPEPEFPVLFARVRDRIANLAALYGPGPLAIDFRALGECAARVQMTNCEIARTRARRFSTRTKQTHSIGGFTGAVEYAGALRELLPFLKAAEWTGVGRHTVWGNGQVRVKPIPE